VLGTQGLPAPFLEEARRRRLALQRAGSMQAAPGRP
jgi:hypothetical protein